MSIIYIFGNQSIKVYLIEICIFQFIFSSEKVSVFQSWGKEMEMYAKSLEFENFMILNFS
jgi:hypothetical protein